MGSCVSVHKSQESAILSHRWSLGSAGNAKPPLIPPLVHKPDTHNNGADPTFAQLPIHSQCPSSRSRDTGSKEETFFDSHAWLESDCEDDFLSINGDFTPSGGSTPVHHHNSSSSRKPPLMEGKLPVLEQSPQPTDKSKRLLSELFKESSRNHLYNGDDENLAASSAPENAKAAAEATSSSPALQGFTRTPNSDSSGERTPPLNDSNNGVVRADDKSKKSVQCCLPRMMISSRSLNERKKKASPAHGSRVVA